MPDDPKPQPMDARTAAAVLIERQACIDLANQHVPASADRRVFCLAHWNLNQQCEDVIAAAIAARPQPT
jgi:hypothetical protein